MISSLQSSLYFLDPDTTSTMADLMWGGVPFTIPSSTAMKYISGAVKVQVRSRLFKCNSLYL